MKSLILKVGFAAVLVFLVSSLAIAWPWSDKDDEATPTPTPKPVKNEPAKTITNSLGMEFVLVPAGSFQMGCDKNFDDCSDDELPRHSVTISKEFYLGKYEVTQEHWVAVMGSNPSKFKARTRPVEQVSWDDVQTFIRKLNAKEGSQKYRLPTEAEWEYAARADSGGKWCFGDDESRLSQFAHYDQDYDQCTSNESCTNPVGKLSANAWGLYDMHGNVWEWVQDWYGENYYSNSPATDPTGPSSGSCRVFRGGSWDRYAQLCRSALRNCRDPGYRNVDLGFRLARSLP